MWLACGLLASVPWTAGCPDFPPGSLHYEGGPGERPCTDRDKDGFTTCEGDCDDDDDRVRPDQTEFFETPAKGGGFDYNCDGKEERLLQQQVQCTQADDAGQGCAGEGWRDEVADCGVTAAYSVCEVTGKACIPRPAGNRTQACR